MMQINLLDWREERRTRRKQQFLVLLVAGVVAAGMLVLGAMFYMDGRIEHQQARNQRIKDEIALMEKRIKEIEELERVKQSLLARMHVIEELQQNRSAMVHFFDEVVRTVPDGVYITSLLQRGADVTVEGLADSNGSVSNYMKKLDASAWFDHPTLVVIKTSDK